MFGSTRGVQAARAALITIVLALIGALVPATPAFAAVALGASNSSTLMTCGDTANLTASGGSGATVWSTSDANVATVIGNNTSATVTSVGPGTATITQTRGGVNNGSVAFTVNDVTAVNVSPAGPTTILKGATQAYAATATGTFNNGGTPATSKVVTTIAQWASSTTATATIASTGVATAVAAGTTNITARCGAASLSTGMTSTASVLNVKAIQSIAVTPASPATLAVGRTQQFTATATYSDPGNGGTSTGDISALATTTWTATPGTVATISNTAGSRGLASAVASGAPGAATITAATSTGTVSGTVTSPGVTLNTKPAAVDSVAITDPAANFSLENAATRQLTLTGTFSNTTTANVTSSGATWTTAWQSSDTNVATVSSSGLVTATGSSGTATITGTVSQTGEPDRFATITVTATPAIVSIAVAPASASVAVGHTQNFTATATYSDTTTGSVTATATWASSDPAIATIASGGANPGRATGVAAGGPVNITATVGSVTSSPAAALTVTAPVLDSISVTPASATVPRGTTRQFSASCQMSDGSTTCPGTLTWASSNTSAATVDSTGLATASGTQGSTTNITASYGGVTSNNAVLTVGAPSLVSAAITPAGATIAPAQTQKYTLTGTYSDGSTAPITATWTSSNNAIASFPTTGSSRDVATGQATTGTVTVTATAAGVTPSPTTSLTVSRVSSIAVTPAAPSVAKGNTVQLTATATYANAATGNVTSFAAWTSTDTAKVTVNNTTSKGLATGAGVGSATVNATFDTVTGGTTVTVTSPLLLSIAVAPTGPTVPRGATQQFTATGTWTDGSHSAGDLTATATWQSQNLTAATIDSSGLAHTLNTATVGDTASITAASNGVTSNTAILTIGAAQVSSVAVTPANPVIAPGVDAQLTATATYTDASTQDVTSTSTWSTGNTAIATVGTAGLLHGVANGSTTVSAVFNTVTGNTSVTVAPPLTALTITATPSLANPLAKGHTQQFVATGHFDDGTPAGYDQVVTTQVTWASSDPSKATINTSGLATAVATSGSTTISASMGSSSGSTVNSNTIQLNVGPAVLDSISILPVTASVPLGRTQQFTATGNMSDGTHPVLTSTATWTSATPSVASISSTGLATVSKTTAVGSTTDITAAKDGVTSNTAVLTAANAVIVSVAVAPANTTLAPTQTKQYVLNATYSDDTVSPISADWGSSNATVASFPTSGGNRDVATANAVGTATITGTGKNANSGWSATTPLTVARISSIAITGTTYPVTSDQLSIPSGLKDQLHATATFTNAATGDVTTAASWLPVKMTAAAVHAYVADGSGANPKGTLVTLSQGDQAISASFDGATANATVHVIAPTLLSIAVAPPAPSVPRGAAQQFTATGTWSDSGTVNHGAGDLTSTATWASSATSVATINSAGLAQTLNDATIGGTTNVTATVGAITGNAAVLTIIDAVVSSIAVTPTNPVIAVGVDKQLTATATYTDAATQDVTATATWSVLPADGSIITVTTGGSIHGVANGSASASALFDGITGSTNVLVSPPLTSLTIAPSTTQSIAKGHTQQFTASGHFDDGTPSGFDQDVTSNVTWVSSDTSAATISTGGLATGVAVGTTSISASMVSSDGATINSTPSSVTLNVGSAVVETISVTPTTASTPLGRTQQFSATCTMSDGTSCPTPAPTWSSSDTAVATVSSTGLATVSKTTTAGSTTNITATKGGVTSNDGVLTAAAPVIVSVAVSPANATIAPTQTKAYALNATYSDDSVSPINATFVSSNNTVASFPTTGGSKNVVTGNGLGSATVTATGTGGNSTWSAQTPLTVAEITAIAITGTAYPVTAGQMSIPSGLKDQLHATATFTNSATGDVTTSASWLPVKNTATAVHAYVADGTGMNPKGTLVTLSQGDQAISTTFRGLTANATVHVIAPILTSIAVSPTAPSVAKGQTQQFVATGTYSDNSTQDFSSQVTWASSDTTVATISASGLASTLAEGATTISAVLGAISSAPGGNATLTVGPPILASIAVSPATHLYSFGDTDVTYTATGTMTDGAAAGTGDLTGLSWSSDDATVVAVDATSGAATAGSVIGATTIRATVGTVVGTASATVAPPFDSIEITPANPSVPLGHTQQFHAVGHYTDSTDPAAPVPATLDVTDNATWTSSDAAKATVSDTYPTKGLATSLAQGTTTITATVEGYTPVDTVLTVAAPALDSITVSPATASVALGRTQAFTAACLMSNGGTTCPSAPVWSSDNTAVATIADPAVGTASTVTQGTANIVATVGSVTGSAALTVTAPEIVSIAISPPAAALEPAGTSALTAIATMTDGTTQNVTKGSTSWASDSTSVATVSTSGSTKGEVTAVANGTANITASRSGVTSSPSVVTVHTLTAIAVTPALPFIQPGQTLPMTATGTYSDAATADLTSAVTWASASPATATIGAGGLAIGVADGTTVISATRGAVSGDTTLTVHTLDGLTVTPDAPTVPLGRTQQFTATGHFNDGTTGDVTPLVTWSSANTAVATVSNAAGTKGLASMLQQGVSTVVASSGAFSDSTVLTVGPPVIDSIAVTPASISSDPGDTTAFQAVATYTDGAEIDVTDTATWASSDLSVATISNTPGTVGVATSLDEGATNITATQDGVVSNAAVLTSGAAVLASMSVAPSSATIAAGANQQYVATGTFTGGSTADVSSIVTWSSSDSGVVSISATGLAHGIVPGTATITATHGATSAAATLTVIAAPGGGGLATSSQTARPGGTITIEGDGFAPGSDVDVTIHSDPIFLGTLVADANGHIIGTFVIPGGLEPGLHTIVAEGVDSDGNPHTITALVRVLPAAAGGGYRMVASDGGVFSFGNAGFFGSTGAIVLNKPIVGMALTPTGNGYWLVASDGGIFAFGDASFFGSTGAMTLNKPVVGMAATPTGKGYWLVASDGGIFAFGDAAFRGSTGSLTLNKPIVGMTATPNGAGYWLVASDGGIFAFGAGFYGSTGSLALVKPVVGMTATPTGKGYWMVASDGGVFSFGDARFFGSTGGLVLNKPVVGMASTPGGNGYWLVSSDGGVFSFGDASFFGSTGNITLARAIVGIAA